MSVFVVVGRTESGDEFVYAFENLKSDDEVDAFLKTQMPDEYEEVGFTNWEGEMVEIRQ